MKTDISLFKTTFIILLNVTSLFSLAQVADDFSDGDFTSNPSWAGDISQFQITSSSAIPPELKPALQLHAEGSDTSSLCVPNSMMMNTEWRFWIKLSFNTSANNFARVYLITDQVNPEGNLNGYFVQIGGAEDSISLYRQSGSAIEKIIPGTIAFTGNSTNVYRIKVTHDPANNWNLWTAADGGYDYVLEGVSDDNSISSTNYFGIYCKFTSSNSTKFYFDDFYVNDIVVDTIPPDITGLDVISSASLNLQFSEPVDVSSSQDTSNYFVNNGIGYALSAVRDLNNFSLVYLEFSQNFNPGINYTLTVDDVSDLNGNTLENETTTFQFVPNASIQPYEIVINEIMADENPLPAGLPEADYLELYNRSDHSINMEACTLKPRESSDPLILPSFNLESGSFLIVTLTSDISLFEPYGQVIGLSGFSLNNEGTVILRNPEGSLVCSVSYTDEWYNDETKKEGGWSLEQIDPQNPCTGKINWSASTDVAGGTPGTQNSVFNTTVAFPEIISAEVVNVNSVNLVFSHYMDSLSLLNTGSYTIDQGMGNPNNVTVSQNGFNSVTLEFDDLFEENKVYNMEITDTLYNCTGNYVELNSQWQVVLPQVAGIYDIVINEIMADPDPPVGLPEYEYIEIFNTTSSYLKMSGWTLKVGSSEKSLPSLVIEPDEYIILTEIEAADLYGMLARSVGFSSLGLTNSGTSVKLLDQDSVVISSVGFHDNWYNDSEKCEGGWSLEQIDPSNPCPGRDNWTVSMDERGGSPGIINSVHSQNVVEPVVIRVIPVTSSSFKVSFNQVMDGQSLSDPSHYLVDRGIGNPHAIVIDSADLSKVILEFIQELEKRKVYTLTVTGDLKSCIGQPVQDQNGFVFGIPEMAGMNDIVINEVLFNPADDGEDFVEIYNRSEKIIDLREIMLGTIEINQLEPNDTVFKTVSEENALLLSNSFLVLTPDELKVKEQYFTPNPDGFTELAAFPAYNNDEGDVILSNGEGSVIEAFHYSETMHHPLLNSFEGVSLERIHYDRPANDITNWHSASEGSGFATPGYKNSQYCETLESDDEITVIPEIFSPDNDGFDDIVTINYHFGAPGFSCSITIFDAHGRMVKTLVNNELLGTKGVFSWNGTTNDNRKADIGIYAIYIEAFGLNGEVKKFRKPVVLAGKL
ncbi:MAG: hypothetical protein FJY07_05995 [Bacteroidetes bacterium]|nr:hypothetical protein [Bacteroidota bacterium]